MFGTLQLNQRSNTVEFVERADSKSFCDRGNTVPPHSACVNCRAKRLRCDGKKPQCSRCKSSCSALPTCRYSLAKGGVDRRRTRSTLNRRPSSPPPASPPKSNDSSDHSTTTPAPAAAVQLGTEHGDMQALASPSFLDVHLFDLSRQTSFPSGASFECGPERDAVPLRSETAADGVMGGHLDHAYGQSHYLAFDQSLSMDMSTVWDYHTTMSGMSSSSTAEAGTSAPTSPIQPPSLSLSPSLSIVDTVVSAAAAPRPSLHPGSVPGDGRKASVSEKSPSRNCTRRCLLVIAPLLEVVEDLLHGVGQPSLEGILSWQKIACRECVKALECPQCSTSSEHMMLLIVFCDKLMALIKRVSSSVTVGRTSHSAAQSMLQVEDYLVTDAAEITGFVKLLSAMCLKKVTRLIKSIEGSPAVEGKQVQQMLMRNIEQQAQRTAQEIRESILSLIEST
ncbi:hypothetical protein F5Y17DRAFT_471465 [Xylariaceae sp. FL0594]|nr:hypothetical protein F5Y17DRAFT_471465 [Xylariaceae sp. FL0594]